jgi:hypothetical protein
MVVTAMAIATSVHPMSASAKTTYHPFVQQQARAINGIHRIAITDVMVRAIAMNVRPILANVPA